MKRAHALKVIELKQMNYAEFQMCNNGTMKTTHRCFQTPFES